MTPPVGVPVQPEVRAAQPEVRAGEPSAEVIVEHAFRAITSPRAETPAPLPAPPSVPASATIHRPGTDGDAQHPRAPSDWIADRIPDARAPTNAPAYPAARKDPSAEEDMLIAAPLRVGGGPLANKKLLAIVGGGVLLLVIVIVAATRGGSKQTAQRAAAPSGSATTVAAGEQPATAPASDEHDPAPPMKVSGHGGTAAIAQPARNGQNAQPGTAPAGSAATVEPPLASEPEPATGSADIAAVAPPAPHHHPTIGGKKVVLEYDTPTHEAAKATPAPAEDAAAVARARASYAAGNKRLFAGDAAGAVHAYQQALAAYPGYVAGYRGLGLAYAQQGDKAKALQAFHTYLSSVPGAKDAPLIKKRVTALSH